MDRAQVCTDVRKIRLGAPWPCWPAPFERWVYGVAFGARTVVQDYLSNHWQVFVGIWEDFVCPYVECRVGRGQLEVGEDESRHGPSIGSTHGKMQGYSPWNARNIRLVDKYGQSGAGKRRLRDTDGDYLRSEVFEVHSDGGNMSEEEGKRGQAGSGHCRRRTVRSLFGCDEPEHEPHCPACLHERHIGHGKRGSPSRAKSGGNLAHVLPLLED